MRRALHLKKSLFLTIATYCMPASSRRPPRARPDEARAWLQRCYGGCPSITGRKHVYPASHHTARWVSLTRQALDWQRQRTWCLRNKAPLPPRNAQFEYVLFHGRPEQIKRRGTRNKHRAKLEAPKGTEVHHRNQRTLALSSAIVVTKRKHDQIHAEIEADKKKAATSARKKKTGGVKKKTVQKRSKKKAERK
jgi:hypothetical protein